MDLRVVGQFDGCQFAYPVDVCSVQVGGHQIAQVLVELL